MSETDNTSEKNANAVYELVAFDRWKACDSSDGDIFAIYPDTGKAEFPIAVKPPYIRDDIWRENAAMIAADHNAGFAEALALLRELDALRVEFDCAPDELGAVSGKRVADFVARYRAVIFRQPHTKPAPPANKETMA